MQTSQSGVQPKLWSFIFIRVGIVTALSGICTQMFMSAFPQYLSDLGFSPTQMGLVASGYTVFAMIMRVLGGNLIDKKGRQLMCLVGLAFFVVPIVGFMGTKALFLIVGLRFIQGIGASLGNLAVGTMAPDVLPRERMGEGIAYFGLFNSLATAIGPAVGITLITSGQSSTFFLVALVMGIAAIAVTMTLNYEKKGLNTGKKGEALPMSPEELEAERLAEAEAKADAERSFLWRFFDKKALPAAIISILVTMSTTTITNFITPYGVELGLSMISSFYTIQAGAMIVARLTSGKLQRRIGRFKTLVLGLCMDVVAMFLLSAMTGNGMMIAAAIIRGLGGGLYFPLLNVLAVEKASRSGRGKATSTYYAAYDLGAGIGAPIWGMVADNFGGYRTVFAGAGVFYVVTFIATYILLGRKEKQAK